MKKLIVASAAMVAVAFLSGQAFANPGGAAKAIEAPSAAVKAAYACRCHHYRHHTRCVAYPLYIPAAPCCGPIFGW